MSWLTGLLGTPKIVNTVADTVKSGVNMFDKAFYTKEEKAENALKLTDTWLKIQKAIADENGIRSITRRILAWGIVVNFLLIIDVGVYLIVAGKLDRVESLKTFIMDTKMGWAALSVVIFYFGYYSIQAIKGTTKK